MNIVLWMLGITATAALVYVTIVYGVPFYQLFVIGMHEGQQGSGKGD